MIALYNSPPNEIRRAAEPLVEGYVSTYFAQGWSLFAPNAPSINEHVLVRGRFGRGEPTRWYDVTEYFLDAMHRDRLTPTHSLFDGLAHAARTLMHRRSTYRTRLARSVVVQTSAMVVRKLTGGQLMDRMEIRIERRYIPAFEDRWSSGSDVDHVDVGWSSIPKTAAL